MKFAIVLLYFFAYYLAARKRRVSLFFTILLYSIIFSGMYFSSGFLEYYDSSNLYLSFGLLCYNMITLVIYGFLSSYGVLGACLHALSLTSLSAFGMFIPLNPLIVLYYDFPDILPRTDIPVLNLLILNLIPAVTFSLKISFFLRSLMLLLFPLIWKTPVNITHPPLNIVIVQVGLYFKKVGVRGNFYTDLNEFVRNKKVDLVILSENVFFGYKNDYIKERTKHLLKQLKDNRFHYKYGILMNLYGYQDINNVVSAFWHKEEFLLHQKSKLIPFFEKKSFYNSPEPSTSPFLYYKKKYNEQDILDFNNIKMSIHICYEGLFPEGESRRKDISIVQSDYSWLSDNHKYDNTLINGSILSKFSVSPNTPLINIQNYGGTVLIDKNWKIDMDLFNRSKTEPFLFTQI
ncbi:dispersin export-associated protein AatD [Escherichia coli]|nr:dispersin export-associated protein AatD [Escherichia coli]